MHSYDFVRFTPGQLQMFGGSADIILDENDNYDEQKDENEQEMNRRWSVIHEIMQQKKHRSQSIFLKNESVKFVSVVDLEVVEQVSIIENIYQFGKRWQYWEYYSQLSTFVIAKYSSLKQEMTSNMIRVINAQDWESTMETSEEFMQCENAKVLQSMGALCHYYGIEQGSQLLVNHMLCLVFYTCFNACQRVFSETFRLTKECPTWETVKQSNAEYAHWSKYLREAVEIYGTPMGKWKNRHKQKLYHGISCQLMFKSTISCFASPTSCTTLLSVANNFCTEEGIIFQFGKYGLDVCFFDCTWISYYQGEDERLLFGGHQPMMIRTVICPILATSFRTHIKAINVLQSMIEGRANREKMKVDEKMMVTALRSMIDSKLQQNNMHMNDNENNYILSLFRHICSSWKNEIKIRMSHLREKNNYLCISHLFMNGNAIDIPFILQLFDACPKVSIYGHFGNDGLQITCSMMDGLLLELKKKSNENLNQLEFRAPNTNEMCIQECIDCYAIDFQENGWIVSEEQSPDLDGIQSLMITKMFNIQCGSDSGSRNENENSESDSGNDRGSENESESESENESTTMGQTFITSKNAEILNKYTKTKTFF